MKELFYCKNCVTPNSRPAITFDDRGFCNACQWAEKKKDIDWNERSVVLKKFVEETLRDANPNREYDCVMTVSGGKDSTFQAWYAKNVLKINPLCVRICPLIPKKEAEHNVYNIAKTVGCDTISLINDVQVFSKLVKKCFIEFGNPYMPFYYNIYSQTTKVALEKNIPMVIIGENGEQEYGGGSGEDFEVINNKGMRERIGKGRRNFSLPNDWTNWGFSKRDLNPYMEPEDNLVNNAKISRFFLSNFVPWNNNEHLHYALNIIGGFKCQNERVYGSYCHGFGIDDILDEFYLWLMWPKFGIQRANKYASTDIREGKLRRPGAVELTKLYDGEFPWEYFDKFLDYMDMSEEEFWSIARKFVSDEDNLKALAKREGLNPENQIPVWKKIGSNTWKHLNTVHGEERVLQIPVPRPSKYGNNKSIITKSSIPKVEPRTTIEI